EASAPAARAPRAPGRALISGPPAVLLGIQRLKLVLARVVPAAAVVGLPAAAGVAVDVAIVVGVVVAVIAGDAGRLPVRTRHLPPLRGALRAGVGVADGGGAAAGGDA